MLSSFFSSLQLLNQLFQIAFKISDIGFYIPFNIAYLRDIFGEQWEQALAGRYTAGAGKSSQQIVNDVWHALFFFDNDDKLKEFAVDKLQCSGEEAEEFCKIPVPQD